MLKYAVLIQYDERDNIFVASVPQLKGCKAHGCTPEEAMKEIAVAQELWLEVAIEDGDEIPKPALFTAVAVRR